MTSSRIDLPGLVGHNVLGFLAALGVLRTASQVWPRRAVRLGWASATGFWTPWLEIPDETFATQHKQATSPEPDDPASDQVELVQALHEKLVAMSGHPAFGFADDLNIATHQFRELCVKVASETTRGDRILADFVASFGSDGLHSADKADRMQDTAIRTMSGAGHQHFLGSMRELITSTTVSHLREALFYPWTYSDPKPSLRWDPRDDRRYALRWKEPSGDAVQTVRGANRLAIEALPLLTTAAIHQRLHTTGFTYWRSKGTFFTWPIWEVPITIDTTRSLLALRELQEEIPDRATLAARGVIEVYRSQRITQGKYRNFTPGLPS